MKGKENSLERLFRSAAQAQRVAPAAAPFAVEARVLARFRNGPGGGDDWFSFLPLFRRGLALACLAAVATMAVSLFSQGPILDETAALNSIVDAKFNYLP